MRLQAHSQQDKQDSQHHMFTKKQLQQINALTIPQLVKFMLAEKFDTQFIDSSKDIWEFKYAGAQNIIDLTMFDVYEKKLLKYFLISYIQTNSPSSLSIHYTDIKDCFIDLATSKKAFTFPTFKDILIEVSKENYNPRKYFFIKFFVHLLSTIDFDKFDNISDRVWETLPRPLYKKAELYYQEIDDPIDSPTVTMIQNGLFKLNSELERGDPISDEELKDASLLSLVYCTGMRSVQISKLAVSDIQIDTVSEDGEFMRYSVLVPYAKQGAIKHSRVQVKLPEEIANIVLAYIKRFELKPTDKLFDLGKNENQSCTIAVNRQLFSFAPVTYQNQVKNGELICRYFSLSDFRHHLAYNLALKGASAEDIAYILGHSSLSTARHYIFSTPDLAQIRAQALGSNPLYQQLIAMLMTGDLIYRDNHTIQGDNIVGCINDQVYDNIGVCSYKSACFLEPVRSCYGCVYFHPYVKGEHEEVLKSVENEIETLVDLSDNMYFSSNPLIGVQETTKFEVESVVKRCKLFEGV